MRCHKSGLPFLYLPASHTSVTDSFPINWRDSQQITNSKFPTAIFFVHAWNILSHTFSLTYFVHPSLMKYTGDLKYLVIIDYAWRRFQLLETFFILDLRRKVFGSLDRKLLALSCPDSLKRLAVFRERSLWLFHWKF